MSFLRSSQKSRIYIWKKFALTESTLKEDPIWYYNLVIPTGTMFSIVYVLDVIDNPFILDISYSEEEIVQHEWINKGT